jgi:dephospho-CoA kinase
MLRIGLSGGLASGKSTVARLLSERGAAVFDADAIVRELYEPGGAGEAAARDLFGDAIADEAGDVDRSRIAALVFADPQARHALEARIHPLVGLEIERRFHAAASGGARVAVAEASQLLEAKTESRYDRVVLVIAPEQDRIRRWEKKGGDPEDARRRMTAQLSPAEAFDRATDVIVNDGTLADLERKVEALWRTWLE